MEIPSQADGSCPLATVEQIRKRLVRPPSLHSQSSNSSTRPREDISVPLDVVNPIGIQRKREEANVRKVSNRRRLEDYLDPSLLAAIRAEIGGNYRKRSSGGERKLKKKESEFEWPVDELKAWTEDRRRSDEDEDEDEAVDLGDDDVEVIRSADGEHDDGKEDGVSCSPFRRFERTALKRLKG